MSDDIPVSADALAEYEKLAPEQQQLVDGQARGAYSRALGAKASPPVVLTTEHGSTTFARGVGDADLSREQLVSGYKNLIARGADPEGFTRAALAAGLTAEELGLDAPPPAEAELGADPLHAALAPPASPMDYSIPLPEWAEDVAVEDIAASVNGLRQAFSAVALPPQYSEQLSRAIFSSLHDPEVTRRDDPAIQLEFREEGSKLRALPGHTEIISLAEAFQARLPKAIFKELNDNFAFHSCESFVACAAAESAIRAREAARK